MTFDDILTRDHWGLSVLIIDDNKFTRDLLRKILVSFGISDVTPAASGSMIPHPKNAPITPTSVATDVTASLR